MGFTGANDDDRAWLGRVVAALSNDQVALLLDAMIVDATAARASKIQGAEFLCERLEAVRRRCVDARWHAFFFEDMFGRLLQADWLFDGAHFTASKDAFNLLRFAEVS